MKSLSGTPLRRVVLKDRVAELIKNAILTGKLEPGERIVEMRLASDLGLGTTARSRSSFRTRSSGVRNPPCEQRHFRHSARCRRCGTILRLRRELEGLAAELIENQACQEELGVLDNIVEGMTIAASDQNLEEFYKHDLEFHRTLGLLSGNRYLMKTLEITVVPLFAFSS